MIGEGTGAKLAAGGLAGGAVFALLEGIPPEPATMMYSLAIAVIGLAGLAFKASRAQRSPDEKVSNSDLMGKLEDFAYGRGGIFERIDKVDAKIETLTGKIERANLRLENHQARIDGLSQRQATDGGN